MPPYLNNLIGKSAGSHSSQQPVILPKSESGPPLIESVPKYELSQPNFVEEPPGMPEGPEPLLTPLSNTVIGDDGTPREVLAEDTVSEHKSDLADIDEVAEIDPRPDMRTDEVGLQPHTADKDDDSGLFRKTDTHEPSDRYQLFSPIKSAGLKKPLDSASPPTHGRNSDKVQSRKPNTEEPLDAGLRLDFGKPRVPGADETAQIETFTPEFPTVVFDGKRPTDRSHLARLKVRHVDDYNGNYSSKEVFAESDNISEIDESSPRNYRKGKIPVFTQQVSTDTPVPTPADDIQGPFDSKVVIIPSGPVARPTVSKQTKSPVKESETAKKVHINIGRVEIKGARRSRQPVKTGVRDFSEHLLMRLYMDGRFR